MQVGVPGSGDVAKALSGSFLKHGHDVMVDKHAYQAGNCFNPLDTYIPLILPTARPDRTRGVSR